MGAYMLKKLAIINMLLKGSAYILIDRTNTGDVTSLTLLNSDYVYIYINGALITELVDLTAIMTGGNVDVTYHYVLNGHIYDKSQIIHLINYPDATGLRGISTLAYAAETLGIAYDTQTHSGSFFRSGANLSGVLHAIAGVTLLKGQAQKAKESFVQALSPALGGTSGGIVALDSGMEFQPISVNPKDSQMIENKAFNVLEICRYFNVPPSLAFSESARHAATAEQQGLGFLNDCLLPLLEKVENEFFRKLYLQSDWKLSSLKFNTENLLRLDATTKADVAAKLFGIGAKTANEIRSDYDAEFPVQGGNTAFVSTNLQPINDLVVSGTAKANTPTKPTSGSTTQNNIDNI